MRIASKTQTKIEKATTTTKICFFSRFNTKIKYFSKKKIDDGKLVCKRDMSGRQYSLEALLVALLTQTHTGHLKAHRANFH